MRMRHARTRTLPRHCHRSGSPNTHTHNSQVKWFACFVRIEDCRQISVREEYATLQKVMRRFPTDLLHTCNESVIDELCPKFSHEFGVIDGFVPAVDINRVHSLLLGSPACAVAKESAEEIAHIQIVLQCNLGEKVALHFLVANILLDRVSRRRCTCFWFGRPISLGLFRIRSGLGTEKAAYPNKPSENC
jgi:hypothetical protein